MLGKYNRIIILVLALLALLAVLIFVVARTSVNDYIDKANQATLQHAVANVNDKIRETQNITYQMATSKYVIPLRQSDNIFDKQAFIQTLELHKWLPSFSSYNSDIAMNGIVFFTSNYVIMPTCGQDLESFSMNFSDAELPNGYSRENFMELILRNNKKFMPRMRYTTYDNSGMEVIPYAIWVGNNVMDRKIAAVSFMNAQGMDEMLSQLLTTELGALCVLDENGGVVASSRALSDSEFNHIRGLSAKNNLRTYWADTASSQWRLVLLSYGDEAMVALGGFRMLVTVIAVTAVVLMIVTALVLSEHNRKKLRNLVSLFSDNGADTKNMYRAIDQQVQLLLSDKQLLSVRLQEQETVLRALAANRLLTGDGLKKTGPLTELAFLPEEKYCLSAILVLNCENEATNESLNKAKSFIKEAVRLFSPDIVTCDVSMSELALILYLPQETDDPGQENMISRLFDTISRITQDNSTFRVRMFAGGVHVGDGAVARSYSEARMALLNASITDDGQSIVRFNGAENPTGCYYYPPETEMRLINLIRSGNRLAAGKLVEELFDQNIVRQSIDYDMAVAFLLDFYGSVLKIQPDDEDTRVMQQKMMELFKNNVRNIGTIEVQKAFINYIHMLTDSFAKAKKSHNQLLADKMLSYVNEHIGDYNLSLTTLADSFGLSGGYCSMFFKEQIGMTFSDFLMRARSERARELILENRLSIAEIASTVGYSSSTAFGRAFKKYYGINPTQVREQEYEKDS